MSNWEDEFASVGIHWPLKFAPYRGQALFLTKIIRPHRPVEIVVLPTGYGKTILQILYAAYAIKTGRARHVVVLVPRDNLRSSMVEEWNLWMPEFVPGIKVLNAGQSPYALLRYAKTNKHLVVIATYQQLNSVNEFAEFCRAYECLVIADEGHHLYDEGVWARNTAALFSDDKIYFTATPMRGDERTLKDVPLTADGQVDPLVYVSIRQGQDEGALCKVRAIAVQFWVDVENKDGIYRVTTDDLQRERLDFSTYEARYQLRYEKGFTTPTIEKMVVIHNAKHVLEPFKHQIMIKAMTTHHADALCEQINRIMGDDDFAHAVHIHKSSEENDELLCRFRGVRRSADGKETPISDQERFPCLVQVDMAGEGYNNPYISTLVKADLTKGWPGIAQFIGRALRVNYESNVPPPKQTIDVLVPDDDIATMELIEADFAIDLKPVSGLDKKDREGDRDIVLLDIPEVFVLEAGFVKLYELNGDGSAVEEENVTAWADHQLPGWREFLSFSQIRAAYMTAGGNQVHSHATEDLSEASLREKWRRASEQAASTLTGNVIRLLSNKALYHNGNEAAGRVKTAIHVQWVRSGGTKTIKATADDFEKKHGWLKELNDRVMSRDIPTWLREAYNAG